VLRAYLPKTKPLHNLGSLAIACSSAVNSKNAQGGDITRHPTTNIKTTNKTSISVTTKHKKLCFELISSSTTKPLKQPRVVCDCKL
jgi:hypothetical protein